MAAGYGSGVAARDTAGTGMTTGDGMVRDRGADRDREREGADPDALRQAADEPLAPESPWGVSEDSPMNEGSEPTAVPNAERGDRRAGEQAGPDEDHFGQLPTIEDTPTREAGPGIPMDPAPPRPPFPDFETAPDQILDR
jgi:hypothetical protein